MKICLDPGHDKGYNPSPCGYGYYEGTRMFELCVLLKAELERYQGVSVVLTRQKVEDDLSLYDRAACGKGCDLLISSHSNAVANEVNDDVDYVICYYPVSGALRELAQALSGTVARVIGTRQAPQAVQKWNSAHNADWMGVIRHSASFGVPALLLEHSFHTNTRVTKWLMSDDNLRLLAAAEAEVIAAAYGLQRKDEGKEEAEMRYNTLADLKADKYNAPYYLPTVEKLMAKGILRGKGGEGDETILDLGEDAVRVLVTLDRAGVYGE